MTYVIILNGLPENGKDSFREYCEEFLPKNATIVYRSSIEVPKEILETYFDWDGGTKNEFWRAALSELKTFWVKICDGPVRFCMRHVLDLKRNTDAEKKDGFFFTDIREPVEISKLAIALSCFELGCKTVMIAKPDRVRVWNNSSDDSVADYKYDATIVNDGSLEDLREKAQKFISDLLMEGKEND